MAADRAVRRWLIPAVLALATWRQISARAQVPGLQRPPVRYSSESIRDLPKVPDDRIDVGLWALVIAKEFDPAVDVQAHLDLLDGMAVTIRRMLPANATDWQKLQAVRAFQFDSGAWNGGKSFRYDLTEQAGDTGESSTLPSYLRTRGGNALTMPTLFLALMERVDPGLRLAAAITPDHIYLRYHDRQTGRRLNIEPSIGGQPLRDRTIIEQVGGVTDLAVTNGLWMRDVTKKELVARLMEPLALRARWRRDLDMEQIYALLMNEAAPDLFWTEVAVYTAMVDVHDYLGEKLRVRQQRGTDYPFSFMDDQRWRMLDLSLEEMVAGMAARGYPGPAERVARVREEWQGQKQVNSAAAAEMNSSQGTRR